MVTKSLVMSSSIRRSGQPQPLILTSLPILESKPGALDALSSHFCRHLGSQTEPFDLDSCHLNPENALSRPVLPPPNLQWKKFDLKPGIADKRLLLDFSFR